MASAAAGCSDRSMSGAGSAASAAISRNDPRLGPFPGRASRPLADAEFGHIVDFLDPQSLGRSVGVCRLWNRVVAQHALNIPESMDPANFLPREAAQRGPFQTKVYNARIYQDILRGPHILGVNIGRASPIPVSISLARSNELDPCNRMPALDPREQHGTIGQNYVWMFVPSHFNISVDADFPLELNKPDDPHDPEAPRLVRKEAGPAAGPGRKVDLLVPITLNNLGVLFEYLNKGKYDYVWGRIRIQHGDKRISNGWVCMREQVVARGQTFAAQQAAARAAGVAIPALVDRLLFNFLRHAQTGVYPDGRAPWTFARTSTRTTDETGREWPTGCGDGGPSGLFVSSLDGIGLDNVGVAAALPAEVQAIGP